VEINIPVNDIGSSDEEDIEDLGEHNVMMTSKGFEQKHHKRPSP
jgi:hypothetical protein